MAEDKKEFLDYDGLEHYDEKLHDSINDYTTGINLLRGTRDFVETTEKFGAFSLNGWGPNTASWTRAGKDDEGYTLLSANRTDGGTNYLSFYQALSVNFSQDDTFTFSLEFMTPDVDSMETTALGQVGVVNKETNRFVHNVNLFAPNKKNIESNKWYKISRVYKATMSKTDELALMVSASINGNGHLYFRKMKIERNSVNKPIWSPSPFDNDYMQNQLDAVNDYTTGINLILGSRDFIEGHRTPIQTSRPDGFYLNGTNYTIEKEEDGFSVLTITEPVKSVDKTYVSSSSFDASYNDVFTISFDLRINSSEDNTDATIFVFYTLGSDNKVSKQQSFGYAFPQVDRTKIGEWQHIVWTVTASAENTVKGFVRATITNKVASLSYRKIMVQRGVINKPIWNFAPFDTEYINDETSGINLLRGTRDFVSGTKKWLNDSYFLDGFYNTTNSYYEKYIDNEGYTVIRYLGTSSGISLVVGSIIESVRNLYDYITVSVEFMLEDDDTSNNNIFNISIRNGETRGDISGVNVTYDGLNKRINNPEPGKWYNAVYTYQLPRNLEENQGIRVSLYAGLTRKIHFRKLCVYKGRINNPVWSASPFDIDYINDITTGINLLRGTRDCIIGTERTWSGSQNYFNDGFMIPTPWEVKVGDDGYSILTVSQSGLDADSGKITHCSSIPCRVGDKFTLSVEFMSPNVEELTGDIISAVVFPDSYAGNIESFGYNASQLTINNDEWVRLNVYITIAKESARYLVPRFRLGRNGTVNFRKALVCKGHINNPIWNTSPFDLAQQTDFKELADDLVPPYLGSYGMETNHSGRITAEKNIDEVLTPGTYQVSGAVINNPTKTTAMMVVVRTIGEYSNAGYTRQILTAYDEGARTYIRYKTVGIDSPWTDWREIVNNKSIIPISQGGHGGTTLDEARNNLKIDRPISVNPIVGLDNDLRQKWLNLQSGIYNINGYQLTGQPFAYGYLYNIVNSTDVSQYFVRKSNNTNKAGSVLGIRFANSDNESMGNFHEIYSQTYAPYTPGLYINQRIDNKFNLDIGDNHVANWLASRVSQGNFDGLNIGDYVDIKLTDNTTVRYLIAGIDTYYKAGNPEYSHHLIMIPSAPVVLNSSDGSYGVGTQNKCLMWNTEANNNGTATEPSPYMASNIHKWEIEVFLPKFPKEWQDIMLERNQLLETRYSASSTLSSSTGYSWKNMGKIWSPSEAEITGRCSCGTRSYSDSFDCQLPFFALPKNYTFRVQFWTRTVQDESSRNACLMGGFGNIGGTNANATTAYPFPCFMIG